MYHVSDQGVDERMINVRYFYFFNYLHKGKKVQLPVFLSPL